MTIQAIMARQWGVNQATMTGPISKMTAETGRHRLTPDTASAAFITLHAAESIFSFAKIIFNVETDVVSRAGAGTVDDGLPTNHAEALQMLTNGFAFVDEQIAKLPDDAQWTEVVKTPFGEIPRMGVLQFVMHHNSYHCGQIAQAIKKGKVA